MPEKRETDQLRIFEPTELGTAAVQRAYLEAELEREKRKNAELRALLEDSRSSETENIEGNIVGTEVSIASEEVEDAANSGVIPSTLPAEKSKEKEAIKSEIELSPAEARYESIVLYILEAGGEVTGEDANRIREQLNLKDSDWGNARLRLRRLKVLELEKLDNGRGYSCIAVNLKVLRSLEGKRNYVTKRVIAKLDQIEMGEKNTEDAKQEKGTARLAELVENEEIIIVRGEVELNKIPIEGTGEEGEESEQELGIEEVEQAFEDYKIPDPSLTKQLEAAERIVLFLLARSNECYASENDNAGGEMRGRIGEIHELSKNDWTNAMTMLREYNVILTEKAGLRRTRSHRLDLEALQQVLNAPFVTERIKARMPENDTKQPIAEDEPLNEIVLPQTEDIGPDPADEVEPPEDIEEPAIEELEEVIEPEGDPGNEPVIDELSMNGADPLDEILGNVISGTRNAPASRNRAPRKQDPRLVLREKVLDEARSHNETDIKFDSIRDIAAAIADSVGISVVEVLQVMKDLIDPDNPVAQLYSYNVDGDTKYKLKLLPPKGKEPKLLV